PTGAPPVARRGGRREVPRAGPRRRHRAHARDPRRADRGPPRPRWRARRADRRGRARAGRARPAHRRTAARRGRSAPMSRILEAAYGYADRAGAWPIIPIRAGDKRPAIKTGIDHAEGATVDLETIALWHRRGLLEAIGTPTGAASGTVVIDVDRKHDGEALLVELEDALGPLPRTKVARTR